MDWKIIYDIRFWRFLDKYKSQRKYDDTCKLVLVYQSSCHPRPQCKSNYSAAPMVSFIESFSCDMFDDYVILELRFSGRYTRNVQFIKDGEICRF